MTDARQRMVASALAASLFGGGAAVSLPFAWPSLYRDDPATGQELAVVRGELAAVRQQLIIERQELSKISLDLADVSTELENQRNVVREFMLVGPAAVRENQKMLLTEVSAIRRLFVAHEQLTRTYIQRQNHIHDE